MILGSMKTGIQMNAGKKGELPIGIIVVIAIASLVLVSLLLMLTFQTGSAGASGDIQQIFNTRCNLYKAEGCGWELTKSSGFDQFLSACQSIYGADRQEFSCLFQLCCQTSENIESDGLCSTCQGLKEAGVSNAACCQQYRDQFGSACAVC